MTDCDGKKLKKGDQVWAISAPWGSDHMTRHLRLGVVVGFNPKNSRARVAWLTPVEDDEYTYFLAYSNQLVRCAGQ